MKKNEFSRVIQYCTEEPFSFMAINNHAPRGQQIRKNLTEIIDLNSFKK